MGLMWETGGFPSYHDFCAAEGLVSLQQSTRSLGFAPSSTGWGCGLGLWPAMRSRGAGQAAGAAGSPLIPWHATAAPSPVSYFSVRSWWKKVNKTYDGVIYKKRLIRGVNSYFNFMYIGVNFTAQHSGNLLH